MLSRDSVPWKTSAFNFDGRVLDEVQLDVLSKTHDLDLDDLRGLSAALTVVLDERRYLGRDDLKAKQRARGGKEVEAAIKDIRAAESKLAKARARLGAVSFDDLFPGTGMPNPASTQLAKLKGAEAVIRDMTLFLEGAVRRDEVTWDTTRRCSAYAGRTASDGLPRPVRFLGRVGSSPFLHDQPDLQPP